MEQIDSQWMDFLSKKCKGLNLYAEEQFGCKFDQKEDPKESFVLSKDVFTLLSNDHVILKDMVEFLLQCDNFGKAGNVLLTMNNPQNIVNGVVQKKLEIPCTGKTLYFIYFNNP